MRAQRGFAVFLLGAGVYTDLGARQYHGIAAGALFGFGLAGVVLALLLVWAARVTRRHLNEPPAYWQVRQDRWRPRLVRLQLIGGILLVAAGVGGVALGHRSLQMCAFRDGSSANVEVA